MPHQVQSTNAKHQSPHFWALIVCCLAAAPQLALFLNSCLMHCETSLHVAAYEALNRISCIESRCSDRAGELLHCIFGLDTVTCISKSQQQQRQL